MKALIYEVSNEDQNAVQDPVLQNIRKIQGLDVPPPLPFAPKWTPHALAALHEAAESYITSILEDCTLVAMHADRTEIQVKDLHLVLHLRSDFAAR